MLAYIIAGFCIFYVIWKYMLCQQKYNYPPGPKGLSLLELHKGFNAKTLYDHQEKYGDVSSFVVFGTRFVVFNTMPVLHEAYLIPKYGSVFNGRKRMTFAENLMFRTLSFSSPSDRDWAKQRQLIQEAIVVRGKNADKIERVAVNELNVVLEILNRKVRDPTLLNSNAVSKEFDMQDIISHSLVNTIIILLIGERLDYDHELSTAIIGWVHEINKLIHPSNDFLLTKFPFLRHLPVSLGKTFNNAKKYSNTLHHYLFDIQKKKLQSNDEMCEGFIFNILRQQSASNWITDDIVKGSIEDIIGATNVTSSAALYSFFLIVTRYQDVQKKIQEEIDTMLNGRIPTEKDKKLMPYTVAVILELLRYTAVTPLGLPHECTETTTFRGYTIPKHSTILNNVWRCHFGKHWEDPWTFKPERFLDENGELVPADHPNRKNVVLFGLGKRYCIGGPFAKNVIFLFIVNILEKFSFLPGSELPSVDPRLFVHSTQNLKPYPYKVRVQPRQRSCV